MSNERKIQTRTVVTVSIEVHDMQPYDDTWTAGSIHRRATESAMNTIACLNRPDLRVVGDPQVRMVITEGRGARRPAERTAAMKGAKELAGILRHMRDHLPLDDIQKGILRESAAHLDAKAAIDSAVTGDIEEIRMQELIAARSDALKSANTALAAENARLVNEHAAAMSRAEVLAEGVRLLAACANIRAPEYEAYQEWRSKHGHMVSK